MPQMKYKYSTKKLLLDLFRRIKCIFRVHIFLDKGTRLSNDIIELYCTRCGQYILEVKNANDKV